ncbi:MAG: hypothetical protein Q9220_004717 [cf. Caloplaca sp. 1 TL-2023]
MSLEERLAKIRSPKLESQRETAIVLSAVEDILKEQQHDQNPTAYFAALLALLSQSIVPSHGIVNKGLATSVVYLLDLVTSHVPAALLRTKFSPILTSLAPALTSQDADAPLVRSSIGCLESLLAAQDAASWALPQAEISPRRATAGLLTLASDHRPKIRKRSQEAISHVLRHPPPTPSLDHPAADLCAEAALKSLGDALTSSSGRRKPSKNTDQEQYQPALLHALQLVKMIASASGGWPSKRIEPLCEVLIGISRSNNERLVTGALEVFEVIFARMADDFSSSKLPRLMEAISELKPSQNDSQLLPPWIAVLSRGYDVSAQVDSGEIFHKLPELFHMVSEFLSSASHDIRVSASECLISFLVNCVPKNTVIEPSIFDEKTWENLAQMAENLLSVEYQAAWMEVFQVQAAFLKALRWRAFPLARNVISTIGELRASASFNGQKEADAVLGQAIESMGPAAFMEILPLNLLVSRKENPGRAWLLPILRDSVTNTNLAHFRSEFVPLSEAMYQRVIQDGESKRTVEIKIFETVVRQAWALFPGYCNTPLDITTAFDQAFAELLSNLLYSQPELRPDICRGLQLLVESNQAVLAAENEEDIRWQYRITKPDAESNLEHLGTYAGNLLAVLFNVYSQTLPQYRGYILQCINTYLSIVKEKELLETFTRVTDTLGNVLPEIESQSQTTKQQAEDKTSSQMPPTSHTLMDLIITLSIYLPLPTFPLLFNLTSRILPLKSDPQLQKKVYKLLPRLATSANGALALGQRNQDLQSLLLTSAPTAAAPARRDRLLAIATVINHLPQTNLHFIPSVLSEAVIATKEVNEKARSAAFDLLVLMARKMIEGGTIDQSKIPHMDAQAPTTQASLEEFFTMVSAGLVGSTPHMVSASITALTRVLYEFHGELPLNVIEDLVSTLTLFLTSNNREIVRSCLGFMKVVIVSLPSELVQPRLKELIPGLLSWSKEHKSRFRAKVKHILERALRRFGSTEMEKWCPEDGKKLLHNIRKTRERKKKRRNEGGEEEGAEVSRKGRFESEYDEAIYGSDDDDDDDDSAASDEEDTKPVLRRNGKQNNKSNASKDGKDGKSGTYIIESPDEPLDLLDRNALGRISTTKPVQFRQTHKLHKSKQDLDGKLVFGNEDDDNAMAIDTGKRDFVEPGDDATLEGGINAYVEAIRGRDAVKRGRGGRLKFSNKRERGREVDLEDEGSRQETRKERGNGQGVRKERGNGRKVVGSGRGVVKSKADPKRERRGLGVQKVRGGRVGRR